MNIKRILVFLFLFGCIGFVHPQNYLPKTDSLRGDIKSIREKLIFLNDTIQNLKLFPTEDEYGHHGFMSREFALGRFEDWWYSLPWAHYVNYYREYDKNRNITSEIWYYKDESFLQEYRFHYDDRNNLIERQEYWNENELNTSKRYTYDHYNRMLSELWLDNEDVNEYFFRCFFYDSKDRLIKKVNFSEEGYRSTINLEYNKQGKQISETVHRLIDWKPTDETKTRYFQDTLTYIGSRTNYIYDEFSNLVQVEGYLRNKANHIANMYVREKHEYDSRNRRIKIIFPNQDGTVRSYWMYDYLKDTNFITKEKHFYPNSVDNSLAIEYVYDQNQRIVKLIYDEDNETNIAEFEYKFDDKGNWYEQLKTVNGKPLYLRKREIIYY
ncbi:MAG: hypothetical protein WCY89_05930 [Flavobacteriaceae bacterium]